MKAPQKSQKRKATYEATLVYMDEPLVITLFVGKARAIAVAVPSEADDAMMFYATSVSQKDWAKYLNGVVDLRYLFTFPDHRNAYTFDLTKMVDGKISITRFLEDAPESYLPSPRFFSSNHTEEYAHEERPDEVERLLVDGDWELSEFGQFNQRYADLYAFSAALKNWEDPSSSLALKQRIRKPFLERPYQGGFSYVHLFNDLNDNVPTNEQLSLDKIQYASPGYVDMSGRKQLFSEIEEQVENFLANRRDLVVAYNELYGYLHKSGFLRINGSDYVKGDPSEDYIEKKTEELNSKLLIGDIKTIRELTGGNTLVSAKVVLSFYRRLHELSSFFAQGRIAYR